MSAAAHADLLFVKEMANGDSDLATYCEFPHLNLPILSPLRPLLSLWHDTPLWSDIPDVQGRAVRRSGGRGRRTAGRRGDRTWDDRFADVLDTAGRKTGKEKDIPHVSFRDL
jgi:hypothetical protein